MTTKPDIMMQLALRPCKPVWQTQGIKYRWDLTIMTAAAFAR